ncbi:cytochrome b/b6 domain-containing protein [Rhabdaerophilum sp. SD176]|uniref:cytochrome b/b6 domain-containing protein n=1 Tax=Rhabdaerophilum sp. SD176 TaxID=2983548 RepID=UPI0024DFFD6E|nr:cytochrome b/b6 domain-containing protein [Rhabdaerophilum sp. SD176]
MTRHTYSGLHQSLHWATFALFLVQLWTYPAIGRTHHAPHFGVPIDPFDLFLHQVHAISGGLILVFAIVRLWLRHRTPVIPPRFPYPALSTISKLAHLALYTTLILLPITGFLKMYIISAAGLVHILLTRLLYVLLVLHVVGVLVHILIWRDGLLERMGIKLPLQR